MGGGAAQGSAAVAAERGSESGAAKYSGVGACDTEQAAVTDLKRGVVGVTSNLFQNKFRFQN